MDDEVERLRAVLERHGVDATTLGVAPGPRGSGTLRLLAPGREVYALWRSLRAVVPAMGYWPVVAEPSDPTWGWTGEMPDEVDLVALARKTGAPAPALAEGAADALAWKADECAEIALSPAVTAATLAEAARLVPAEPWQWARARWRTARAQRLALGWALPGDDADAETDASAGADADAPVLPSWPEDVAALRELRDYARYPAVDVELVPVRASYEVPAAYQFGGFNDCPTPAQHVAMLRHWHERYGAELISVSGGAFELRVELPPRTREAAWALADEHQGYCSDRMDDRGCGGSLARLAAQLLGAPVWYFLWD